MLSQSDADRLIVMPKRFATANAIILRPGCREARPLEADDPKERFIFDLQRSSIRLTKLTTQNRARVSIVLVRLDSDGAPHTNPDGKRIDDSHLHIYREGWDDKWAYPLDPKVFTGTEDHAKLLAEFCEYCRIGDLPVIQVALL